MKAAERVNDGLASARVRRAMVGRVRELGVRDARVLAALEAVPRHTFVDAALASRAYEDTALPIGHGQTISQPYIVARSAELAIAPIADPRRARVLEIGTGCGYATALLAQLFGRVVSIERLRALHVRARERLRPLRLANVHLLLSDGMAGCAEQAPFDAIVAAAAADAVPQAWIDQLAAPGNIVAPVGGDDQMLVVIQCDAQRRVTRRNIEAVRFVPMRAGLG